MLRGFADSLEAEIQRTNTRNLGTLKTEQHFFARLAAHFDNFAVSPADRAKAPHFATS